jgi:hypothetical protein
MKPVLVFASLSLMSMCAFASEPAAATAGQCAAPVIPPVSTSQVGVQRVEKILKQWDDCVLAQSSDENKRLDAEVKAKSRAWMAATIQYSNGQAAGTSILSRVEVDKFEAIISRTERERFDAKRQAMNQERVATTPSTPQQPRSDTM